MKYKKNWMSSVKRRGIKKKDMHNLKMKLRLILKSIQDMRRSQDMRKSQATLKNKGKKNVIIF